MFRHNLSIFSKLSQNGFTFSEFKQNILKSSSFLVLTAASYSPINKDKCLYYFKQFLGLCGLIIICNSVINIEQLQMNEYEQNIDYNDVFNYLTFNQVEQSEFISIHSQSSHYFQQNHQSQSKQLEIKPELPTSDKKNMEDEDSVGHEAPPMQSQENCINFRLEVKSKYAAVHQGTKDDTVELNINFKTIIFNYLKQLLLANEFSTQDAAKVQAFGNRSPSFKSIIVLCDCKNESSQINKLLLAFIESPAIIRKILESKCKIVTKILMIKFVEILRLNIKSSGKIIRWKQYAKR